MYLRVLLERQGPKTVTNSQMKIIKIPKITVTKQLKYSQNPKKYSLLFYQHFYQLKYKIIKVLIQHLFNVHAKKHAFAVTAKLVIPCNKFEHFFQQLNHLENLFFLSAKLETVYVCVRECVCVKERASVCDCFKKRKGHRFLFSFI